MGRWSGIPQRLRHGPPVVVVQALRQARGIENATIISRPLQVPWCVFVLLGPWISDDKMLKDPTTSTVRGPKPKGFLSPKYWAGWGNTNDFRGQPRVAAN
jgi:hypothetical protein